jgi:hypothetical protein
LIVFLLVTLYVPGVLCVFALKAVFMDEHYLMKIYTQEWVCPRTTNCATDFMLNAPPASTAFLQALVEVVEQFLAQFCLLVLGCRGHAFLRQFDEGFLGTAR